MVMNPADPPAEGAAAAQAKITDAAVMRALAHPARLTLLQYLGEVGSATATGCAELVGLSPSATSYHLRALAKVGLVEQAPGRGDGRERLWRTLVPHGYLVDAAGASDPDTRHAQEELMKSFLAWDDARLKQYLARLDQEPPDWHAAAFLAEAQLVVTVEELERLGKAVADLLRPYRKRSRPDPPPGARVVSALFRAFPIDDPPL